MAVIPAFEMSPENTSKKKISPNHKFSFCNVGHIQIKNIISTMKDSRSTDSYGLSVRILKINITTLISPLTKLVNSCLTTGCFPNCLKISNVIPGHKMKQKNDINNYRPIFLVPIFSKILEKVITDQIIQYFEDMSLLSGRQFGFRKGRSTTEAIIQLVNYVISCFNGRKYCLASCVDLTKTFVTCDMLLHKLSRYGFD